MKRTVILLSALLLILTMSACAHGGGAPETTGETVSKAAESTTEKTEQSETGTAPQEETTMNSRKIFITVNGKRFSATPEDNAAADELYQIIKTHGLTVKLSDYSGFEKVGALGHTLRANDKQITTKPGDIVLYMSDQIVMFYGSNTWSYTPLARVDDLTGWAEALGSGDVTAEFSAE